MLFSAKNFIKALSSISRNISSYASFLFLVSFYIFLHLKNKYLFKIQSNLSYILVAVAPNVDPDGSFMMSLDTSSLEKLDYNVDKEEVYVL